MPSYQKSFGDSACSANYWAAESASVITVPTLSRQYRGIVMACVCVGACSQPTNNPPPQDTSQRTQPHYVGKVWMSIDQSAALGTFRIFLPDGTLVMDSCGETYRLALWRAIEERHIEWQEDSARIEAEVRQMSPDQLRLRLQLVGEVKEENYRLARAPFVCPDARPSPNRAGGP